MTDLTPAKVLDRAWFQPGEVIFREGEGADHAYVVTSGIVEIARLV